MSPPADGRGWVLPYWWERQTDPTSPAFVPGSRPAGPAPVAAVGAASPVPDLAGLVVPVNRTHREVVAVGTLGTRDVALVDPRGLVQLEGRAWSLDWLIGADDGWHAPARVGGVRQTALDGTGVVETRVRVKGGEVLQRVYATRAPGAVDAVVVEVRNDTPVPMAVAFVIRPFLVTGLGRVGSVELEGHTVLVDGMPVVTLPKAPGRWAGGTARDGDAAAVVLAGLAAEPPVDAVDCPQGLATAAFVVPVAHTTSARVVLPLGDPAVRTAGHSGGPGHVTSAVASAEQVAAGWADQIERAVRLRLPAGALADRARSALATVLLAAGDEDLRFVPERRGEPAEEALVLGALDAFGFHEESRRVLATIEERIALDGYLGDRSGHWDANGAALAALGAHCHLSGDDELAMAIVGPLAKAAHWPERRRRPRRARTAPRVDGMLPDGPGPRWVGGTGAWFRDLAWSLAGLRDAAVLLDRVGQPETAADVARLADLLGRDLVARAAASAVAGAGALAPQPDVPVDHRIPASLECLVLAPDLSSEIALATLEAVGERASADGLVLEPATGGHSPLLTAWSALALAAHRPQRAAVPVQAVAAAAPMPAQWPEVLHPRTHGGAAGDGWHPPSAAAFLLAVRRLLVAERSGGCWWDGAGSGPSAGITAAAGGGAGASPAVLDLLPALPADWLGTSVEIHGLPTGVGTLSYALRWHGPRPALLWEITPRDDAATPPVVRSSLLDPSWDATGWTGEVLLAEPPGHVHEQVEGAAHEHDDGHHDHAHGDDGAHG